MTLWERTMLQLVFAITGGRFLGDMLWWAEKHQWISP